MTTEDPRPEWVRLYLESYREWQNRNERVAMHADGVIKWLIGVTLGGLVYGLYNPDFLSRVYAQYPYSRLVLGILCVAAILGLAFRASVYCFLLYTLEMSRRTGELVLEYRFNPERLIYLQRDGDLDFENDQVFRRYSSGYNRWRWWARVFGWISFALFVFGFIAIATYVLTLPLSSRLSANEAAAGISQGLPNATRPK